MATNLELDAKTKALEKALEEFQGAIRRHGEELNNLTSMLSKVSGDLSTLKVEMTNLKTQLNKLGQKTAGGVSRYE